MRTLLVIVMIISLAACTQEEKNCDNDSGAPFKYVPVSSNNANIILHNGHGPWTCSMTLAANNFARAGFTVYRAEMPASPHDLESEFFLDTDRLLNDLSGKTIYMVGLSGGGWTTTMATALNPEIAKGYSVAGDHPVESYDGDYEQQNPPLEYSQAYSIAVNRLLHIYNKYDTCCFSNVTGNIGTPYVIDDTHRGHRISQWATNYIINDIGL